MTVIDVAFYVCGSGKHDGEFSVLTSLHYSYFHRNQECKAGV